MLHTSSKNWPEKKGGGGPALGLKFPLAYMDKETNEVVSGKRNTTLKLKIDSELRGSQIWAYNVIYRSEPTPGGAYTITSRVPTYVVTLLVNPELIEKSQTFRKEVFGQELVEIAIGLDRFEDRRKRRILDGRIDSLRAGMSLDATMIMIDNSLEAAEVKEGLFDLLLSDASIEKCVREDFRMDLSQLIEHVLENGGGQLVERLCARYKLRDEIARNRLKLHLRKIFKH
jgi:hypothetical protein